jgi:hypothetical protein
MQGADYYRFSKEPPYDRIENMFFLPTYVRLGGDWALGRERVPTLDVPRRCVIMRSATSGNAVVAPAEILDEFTPGLKRGFSLFPEDVFRSSYCEPLDTWYEEAHTFAATVVTLTDPAGGPARMETQFLNAILSSVGHCLQIGASGAVSIGTMYPSLLAAFAEMVAQDLLAAKRILRCSLCDVFSVTSAYQTKYCSKRCAWRARKRRQRESEV